MLESPFHPWQVAFQIDNVNANNIFVTTLQRVGAVRLARTARRRDNKNHSSWIANAY